MNPAFYTVSERLLSATANGLYQGVLVAALAALVLKLIPRTNAATRHAIWMGALVFVTALIPAHLLFSYVRGVRAEQEAALAAFTASFNAGESDDRDDDATPAENDLVSGPDAPSATSVPDVRSDAPTPELVASSASVSSSPPSQSGSSSVQTSDFNLDRASDPPPVAIYKTESAPESGEADAVATSDDPAREQAQANGQDQDHDQTRPSLWASAWSHTWSRVKSAVIGLFSLKVEKPVSLPHWLSLALISAWVLCAGIRGGLVLRRLLNIRRAKNDSTEAGDELNAMFDKLRASLPDRQNVRLRMSHTHSGAVLLGFAHPVVLLPADIEEDLAESGVEHVLRHELAHVARWDDWGNLMQQAVEAALFFHPAVWWISRRLSLEREIACDDHVLEASDRPREYTLTLANVASRMNQCRHLLSPGVSNNHSQLQQRINMILNKNRDRSSRLATRRLGAFTTATALLAVLAVTAGPRLVLAEPSAAPSPAPSADGTHQAAPDSQSESGPRSKDDNKNDNNNNNDTARAFVLQSPQPPVSPLTPPTPPAPAAVLIAPDAPAPPVAPVAIVTSVHPLVTARVNYSDSEDADSAPKPSGHPKVHRDQSVEERLDRIEKVLKELQEHRHVNAWAYSAGPGKDAFVDADGKSHEWVFKFNDEEAKRAGEEARRAGEEARRAAEQAKRFAEAGERAAEAGRRVAEQGERNAERAMRDMEKMKGQDFEKMQRDIQDKLEHLKTPDFDKLQAELQMKLHDMQGEGSVRELEALRSARDSLAREMENLSRQIHQLEHVQKHENKHKDGKGKDGKSDDSEDDSDNDKPEAPEKQ